MGTFVPFRATIGLPGVHGQEQRGEGDMTDHAGSGSPSIDAWLGELAAAIPEASLDDADPAVRSALLDVARIAAHRSHRTAAPITTYLVGLALGPLEPADRLARLQDLVRHLDNEKR